VITENSHKDMHRGFKTTHKPHLDMRMYPEVSGLAAWNRNRNRKW